MKKAINITCYVLSILFIVLALGGGIFYAVYRNKQLKQLPTLPQALQNYELPILEIKGNTNGISKDNEINVSVKYHSEELNFNSKATLKWQGASSLAFEKKNYTIKFVDENGDKNKVQVKESWGEQNKYCLKANYIDYTSARNVVSAKLYGQIVHSRNIDDELNSLVNGGAIDGFPVIIFMNNKYHGLYTFNIPKDKWLFNMKSKDQKAILMADTWSNSTRLIEPMNNNFTSSGWELEWCSTEEEPNGTDWVAESFNKFIRFVNENDGEQFINGITSYVNVDRAIDSMIYTLVLNGRDNLSKNILWVTYDGQKWHPSMYDLDSTWGIFADGSILDDSQWLSLDAFKNHINTNLLWKKLLSNYETEVKARYQELRQNILSFSNISYAFSNFVSEIPTEIYQYEPIMYRGIPSQNTSNLTQILSFAKQNLKRLDKDFGIA